jgi:FkbM family methyltransferase
MAGGRRPGLHGRAQNALVWLHGALRAAGWLDTPLARTAYLRAYFAYKRHLEDPFTRLAARYPGLFAGGDVLDVGANVGFTALLFAAAVDPGRKVHAFEPVRGNFEMLDGLVRSRRMERTVVPVHAAVGSEEGTAEMWINPRQSTDHRVATGEFRRGRGAGGQVEHAPLVTLDGYVRRASLDRIAFVKVDVQGYEWPVCQGMARLLEQNPGASVAVEHAPTEAAELGLDAGQVFGFFLHRGYGCYRLERQGPPVRLPGDAPPTLARGTYLDILFTRNGLDP